MQKFDNTESKIYKKNIAQTCGQANCHVKQLAEFEGSIHDVSIMNKENSDAPSCNGCHGNHQILKKDEGENRIGNSKGLVQLCSDCHNSVELTEKYNLPGGRTSSYNDSYHGLAVRGGSKVAANCESCHGNHNIRPSSDSLSTISKKNLPETCGKCHPGATTTFFNTPIHIVNASEESPVLYWVRNFYLSMIFGLIGFMVLHNIFDFTKKFRKKK
jgi:nitrate/TMAO reductase-like tetraheme cytochrome c subunit